MVVPARAAGGDADKSLRLHRGAAPAATETPAPLTAAGIAALKIVSGAPMGMSWLCPEVFALCFWCCSGPVWLRLVISDLNGSLWMVCFCCLRVVNSMYFCRFGIFCDSFASRVSAVHLLVQTYAWLAAPAPTPVLPEAEPPKYCAPLPPGYRFFTLESALTADPKTPFATFDDLAAAYVSSGLLPQHTVHDCNELLQVWPCAVMLSVFITCDVCFIAHLKLSSTLQSPCDPTAFHSYAYSVFCVQRLFQQPIVCPVAVSQQQKAITDIHAAFALRFGKCRSTPTVFIHP